MDFFFPFVIYLFKKSTIHYIGKQEGNQLTILYIIYVYILSIYVCVCVCIFIKKYNTV